jgi:hypothetical protein
MITKLDQVCERLGNTQATQAKSSLASLSRHLGLAPYRDASQCCAHEQAAGRLNCGNQVASNLLIPLP